MSNPYNFFFLCMWKGHRPFAKPCEQDPIRNWLSEWYDVECEDCEKPMGAFAEPQTLDGWKERFTGKDKLYTKIRDFES